MYSCMLREDGGVIDDLITYFMDETWFRVVVNAGTAEKDIDWISQQARPFSVDIRVRTDLALIAVQGPNARAKTLNLLPDALRNVAGDLKPFNATSEADWFVGRTGYTGEDGFEVALPQDKATSFWLGLHENGVRACGLGSRDTLRLEAGMNLYGQDMDESVTPLESGLGWTVSITDDRDFIGKAALEAQKASGNIPRFGGIVLEGRGILREHQKLFQNSQMIGETTSGGFSPTLEQSIGMARHTGDPDQPVEVEIRNKRVAANWHKLPFVRNGKAC